MIAKGSDSNRKLAKDTFVGQVGKTGKKNETTNPNPTIIDHSVGRQGYTQHGFATQWMVAPELHPR